MPARPFCLHKPSNSTNSTAHPPSHDTQASVDSLGLRHSQALQRETSSKQTDKHADVRRSYDMISRQIRCSAAVQIVPRLKFKKVRKEEPKKQPIFMQHFEEVSRNLIPHRQSQDNCLTLRKRTTKLTKFMTQTVPTDHHPSLSPKNNDQTSKQQSDGYYARLKKRLRLQIEGLTEPECDRVTEEIRTSDDKESDVGAALRQKREIKNSETWVRVSRTGLVMPVSEMERRARGTNLAMIENYKAKKDFNFQKCLTKNCSIILQQIARHEAALEKSPGRERRQRGSEPPESILRKSHCSQQREESMIRRSADGMGMLRWRERCLQIQLTCRRGFDRSSTQAGLRVFSKYSRRVRRQMQADQIALNSLLHYDPTLSMEEDPISIQKTFFQK